MPNQYTPPMRESEEATSAQLELARRQGEAYEQALKTMATEVADTGDEARVGDYIVAVAIEGAEGMWRREDGELRWVEPTDENCHIEISVRDGADNRFIPGLDVEVTLSTDAGEQLGRYSLPFLWHPWLYHYGRNVHVPRAGRYTLHVHVAAPEFARHDPENGKRYAEAVGVTFEAIEITPSRK